MIYSRLSNEYRSVFMRSSVSEHEMNALYTDMTVRLDI
jgi:hypothetical protein